MGPYIYTDLVWYPIIITSFWKKKLILKQKNAMMQPQDNEGCVQEPILHDMITTSPGDRIPVGRNMFKCPRLTI